MGRLVWWGFTGWGKSDPWRMQASPPAWAGEKGGSYGDGLRGWRGVCHTPPLHPPLQGSSLLSAQ